jgi:hypothetical protein
MIIFVDKKLKLKEIAAKINVYLKRFEEDPAINTIPESPRMKIPKYFEAAAWSTGRRVNVRYILFQGSSSLTKDEALVYLMALDNGYIGRHYNAEEWLGQKLKDEEDSQVVIPAW